MATLDDAIRQAVTRGLDRLDAQLLMLHALGLPPERRTWLIAHAQTPLEQRAQHVFNELCHKRLDDVPLSYLTGSREFHGLRLCVDTRVLDPRPDTETLVDWALSLGLPDGSRVADLGTGSGAVALALKAARPSWAVTACDLSEDALQVASANAARLGLDVRFVQGDWCRALTDTPSGQATAGVTPLDLIVSNPPYIRASDPHLPALRHEPLHALASGPDGLDAIRQIISGAMACLRHGGWLLLEHGHDQAMAVTSLLAQHGFAEVSSRTDLAGITRCTGARRPQQG